MENVYNIIDNIVKSLSVFDPGEITLEFTKSYKNMTGWLPKTKSTKRQAAGQTIWHVD